MAFRFSAVRRVLTIGLIPALVFGAIVLDRTAERKKVNPDSFQLRTMPAASSTESKSSTWYCAAVSADALKLGTGSVIMANPTDRTLLGTVRFTSSDGTSKTVPVTLLPRTRETINQSDVLPAPHSSAVVELNGGGAVVEHMIQGPLGHDVSPCASFGAQKWYLADGSTFKDSVFLLYLYNPFPTDAQVDMSFVASDAETDNVSSQRSPHQLQGYLVPAGSLRVINVGDWVRRRAVVSTSIVARTGRVVVDQLQVHNRPDRLGIALSPATPSPAKSWDFSHGAVGDGVVERFHIYNPSAKEAVVELQLLLDQGFAEPFEMRVPPNSRHTEIINAATRVPQGIGHSAILRSLNGVPFVVQRTIDYGSPQPLKGFSGGLGIRENAKVWSFAAGNQGKKFEEVIVVTNTRHKSVKVTLVARTAEGRLALPKESVVTIAQGRRALFPVNTIVGTKDAVLTIEADKTVLAERVFAAVDGLGVSDTFGIPTLE